MAGKQNREQRDASDWKTENSEPSEASASMHHHSPGSSNSTRGNAAHWGPSRQPSIASSQPSAPTQAPQASASNNPFSVLDTNPDADSPESSGSGPAAQATASTTPQGEPHFEADDLIDLTDNGRDQQSAASPDPYQDLGAFENQLSGLSVCATSPQSQTQSTPSLRGRPSPRGRPSSRGRGGLRGRGQADPRQSFRGQSNRGQSSRGGGRYYSAASPSRGSHISGHNHHPSAGPSSRSPSWPGGQRGFRGSSSGPGRSASSRVPSSPGSLRGPRGLIRQSNSGPGEADADDSIYVKVPRHMERFLTQHKDRHGSYPPRLQEIASMSNTDVTPVRRVAQGRDGDFPVMELKLRRPTSDAVHHFKGMFEQWCERVLEEVDPQWADAPGGYIPHVEKARAKAIRDKDRREKFCHPRPDGSPDPLWSISVDWTSSTQPGDILGPKHAQLDPIRKQNSCWITCERDAGRFFFTVEGDDNGKVLKAVGRMQQVVRQAEASQFTAETVYILDVADGMDDLPDVQISEYFGYSANNSLGKKPKFASPTSPVSFTKNTGPVAMQTLVESITPTTDRVRFYRNYLEFRISLGTFVMKTYPANTETFDFDDFSDAMEENRMLAIVTKEIGDPKIESTLLQRLCGATHLLQVPDVPKWMQKPIYSATFKFNNKDNRGQLMLHVELSYAEGSTTVEQRHWYRAKQGDKDIRKILDVNMVNLNQGFAWHFGMTAAETVEESSLSEDYQNFPDSLSLNTESHNFVVYGPHGGRSLNIPLHSVYQKRLWRIETGFGYWFVEVAGGHETTFSGREKSCGTPKWTLNVLNGKHEVAFSSNEGVDVGELANWGPGHPIEELFPFDWEPSVSPEEPPQQTMTTSFKEHVEGKGKGKAHPENEEKPAQKTTTKRVGGKGKGKADPDDEADPGAREPDLKGLKQLLRLLHGLHDVVVEGDDLP